MLRNREISASLGSSFITAKVIRGCPQGGVLSPLLWSLVVDELLTHLQSSGFEVVGFADDVVIIVRGKYDHIIKSRMQISSDLTSRWTEREGLKINPSKTTIVCFTRRRTVSITNLQLEGLTLELSPTVKDLGVTLDSKLNWNAHSEQVINKGLSAMWISKITFGNRWGLKPRMIYWIYSTIVRPRITYASLVWWPKINEKSAQQKLEKLQRKE